MRLHFCGFLVFILFLFPLVSEAHRLSPTDEARARASVTKLVHAAPENYDEFILKLFLAFKKGCDDALKNNTATCLVHECDLGAPDCRPNRRLFFRGEPGVYPTPSVSALLRTHWRNSNFESRSSTDTLMNRLKSSVAVFRPMTGPDQGENVVLVRHHSRDEWFYIEEDKVSNIPFTPTPGIAAADILSFVNLLYIFHTQDANLHYQDPKLGMVSLDPLVSYSMNPLQALRFSENGRLIILSVPESELVTDCRETLPPVGSFFDPSKCATQSQFAEENEFDAILFPSPEYVWKSFLVPKERWPRDPSYPNYIR